MDRDEYVNAHKALINWFESQEISSADAAVLCLHFISYQIVKRARSETEALEGCDVFHRDLAAIAKKFF